MRIIEASKEWDLNEYKYITFNYLKLIKAEIYRVNMIIEFVANGLMVENDSVNSYTKKQAAEILGTDITIVLIR